MAASLLLQHDDHHHQEQPRYLLRNEFTAADIIYLRCLDWAKGIGWHANWPKGLDEYRKRCQARPTCQDYARYECQRTEESAEKVVAAAVAGQCRLYPSCNYAAGTLWQRKLTIEAAGGGRSILSKAAPKTLLYDTFEIQLWTWFCHLNCHIPKDLGTCRLMEVVVIVPV